MREMELFTSHLKSQVDMTASAEGLHDVADKLLQFCPMAEFKGLEKILFENFMKIDKAEEEHEKLTKKLDKGLEKINDKVGSGQLKSTASNL